MNRHPSRRWQARPSQAVSRSSPSYHTAGQGKRARGVACGPHRPFIPPEDWYQPDGSAGYRIVVQPPGTGLRHILTPQDVRDRLAALPAEFTAPLEVVQMSRMTRKKQTFPCYGMQWGSSVYLYPVDASLVEYFCRPPRPAQQIEARQFGGRWVQESANLWKLVWTERAIRDFYLNSILIHELGHLLDQRNTGYAARERYAEWFALEYGYKPTRGLASDGKRRVVRRHG